MTVLASGATQSGDVQFYDGGIESHVSIHRLGDLVSLGLAAVFVGGRADATATMTPSEARTTADALMRFAALIDAAPSETKP